ncbi:hypothetical protein L0F63_006314 [Massospora cicadina]|nr:hypothetical protein L0F63_006314 [Massospora cicadina]
MFPPVVQNLFLLFLVAEAQSKSADKVKETVLHLFGGAAKMAQQKADFLTIQFYKNESLVEFAE